MRNKVIFRRLDDLRISWFACAAPPTASGLRSVRSAASPKGGRSMSTVNRKPLRVCRDCDLKAYTTDDLELFVKCRARPHGRSNICKKCDKTWKLLGEKGRRPVHDDQITIVELEDRLKAIKNELLRVQITGSEVFPYSISNIQFSEFISNLWKSIGKKDPRFRTAMEDQP